ncbi:AEC family transporter [Nesterenkonia marinintestina]|uniref:AEC family transporter n=1 Tax=Nesterenkonia marinintestina TaxID=2979865 RepID=UPI0021C0A0C3|nr:AEC family transporter [Nesterenkonia sp. GX14115]
MTDVLVTIAPLTAMIVLGFAAGWSSRLAAAESGLNVFVLHIALPAFLFSAVAGASLEGGLPVPFLLIALLVPTAVSGAVLVVARAVPGLRERRLAGPLALTGGYGNVGYLGVPLGISLLGAEAALAVGIGQLLHNLVFMIGYPLLAEAGTSLRRTLVSALLLNPVALSIFAGLAVAAVPRSLPGPVDEAVELLAGAAVPVALFAVGLALHQALTGLRSGQVPLGALTAATAVKMLLLPAATWGAAMLVGLEAQPTAVLVLLAIMPTSTTAYLFAHAYDGHGPFGAATIFVTTVLSVGLIPLAFVLVQT